MPLEESKAVEEIETGPDRVAAIVAAALVEATIADIISRRLKTDDSPTEKKARKELLGLSSPLGQVSSRIGLAYLLRMLSEDAYLDLRTIGEIRNKFAHKPAIATFSLHEIKQKCSSLRLIHQQGRITEAAGRYKDITFPTTIYSVSSSGEGRVGISVVNHRSSLQEPRGQFLLTVRLILAAFHIYNKPEIVNKKFSANSEII